MKLRSLTQAPELPPGNSCLHEYFQGCQEEGGISNSSPTALDGSNSAGHMHVCVQPQIWDVNASFGKGNRTALNNSCLFLNYSIIGAHSSVLRS